MSWNFTLLIFINVRCDESSFRINYVHSPDGELLRSVREWLKSMHTGFSAYTYCIMPTPGADTEETGRYDLAERFV